MLRTRRISYKIRRVPLLSEVSLQFKPGHISGIIGPNGSGKSTLLKTLCGIWKADAGEIFWHERSILQWSRAELSRLMTLVPQNPVIAFDFSVTEMIEMAQHLVPKEKRIHLSSILEATDLIHLQNRSVMTLSSGERQRVYIGRAIATGASILLLDEPTSSLDIQHQMIVWKLMNRLALEGKTIIVSLHDLVAAKQHCHTIAVMNNGHCVIQGNYEECVTPSVLQQVFGV